MGKTYEKTRLSDVDGVGTLVESDESPRDSSVKHEWTHIQLPIGSGDENADTVATR